MVMNPTTSRRSLLFGAAGLAAASTLGLSGCGSSSSSPKGGSGASADAKKLLPTYKEGKAPTPQLSGGQYIEPGYLEYPKDLTQSVADKPGRGSTFKTAVMYWGDPQPENSTYSKAINDALGCTMTFLNIPANDYDTKMSALLAGGNNLPDLVTIPGWGPPVKMYDAYNKAFANLTDKLSGDNVLKYPNLAAIPSTAWRAGLWGGTVAAVPSPGPAISYVTLYRKDLFDKAGVKPPTSQSEFEQVLKALTNRSTKRFGIGNPLYTAIRMYGLHPNEYPWGTENGRMTHLFEQDGFADMLDWCRKMRAQGYVHPDTVGGNGDQKALFKGGQIAIASDGYDSWAGYQYGTQDPAMEKGFDADALVPFAKDGGNATVYADGGCVFITFLNKRLTGDKLEEALRVLDYLAAPFGSKEYQLVHYGVEGTDFTMKNGVPTLTDAGNKEIKSNFGFTASGPRVDFSPVAPEWVKRRHAWTTATAKMTKPLDTAGIYVNMPAQLAANRTKPDAAITAIINGKQPVSDWANVLTEWQNNFGNKIRDIYAQAVASNK